MAGGIPIFSDISREDLCITAENILNNITSRTKAVLVVHIAGHIAFDIDAIVTLCQDKNIVLIEDCAHAHGASFKGRVAGQFGLAGAYSFYATKSLPLGEGGMVVSSDENFIKWVEKYRNYGKAIKKEQVTYPMLDGFNFRINEFTAALGLVQLKRFPQILDWKRSLAIKYDQIFNRHITFPKQMLSGFYKYVVWDYPDIIEKTGQVFGPNDLNHKIANAKKSFPNAEWVTKHHQCLPIYNGWDHAHKSVEELASYLIPNNS
jgi:dTDP-4-amino-4,6-dideoxygalactose transaminase